jgi:hypothetical protein
MLSEALNNSGFADSIYIIEVVSYIVNQSAASQKSFKGAKGYENLSQKLINL